MYLWAWALLLLSAAAALALGRGVTPRRLAPPCLVFVAAILRARLPSAATLAEVAVIALVARDPASTPISDPRALAARALLVAGGAALAFTTEGPAARLVLWLSCLLPLLGRRPAAPGWDLSPRAAAALGAVAVVVVVAYGLHVLPWIGGKDFYSFVCHPRDDLLGVRGPDHDIRYCYFPGVYSFYRAVMRLGGPHALLPLQSAYLLVLAATAALVALVVHRATRVRWLTLAAALWFVHLLGRYEGLEGCIEPLAALPALAGVAAWGGRPLSGRAGLLRAACLGVGFGLAVYMKQQGALLAMSAVVLLPLAWAAPPAERPWLAAYPLMVGVAVAVLLLGVLAEGRGLVPFELALRHVGVYSAVRPAWWSLSYMVHNDPFHGAAVLGSVALLLAWWRGVLPGAGRLRQVALRPEVLVAAFAATVCVLTQAQLLKRPYAHYQLLAVPFAPIAVAIAVAVAARERPALARRLRLPASRWAVVALLGVMFTSRGPHDPALALWPLPPSPGRPDRPIERPDIALDVQQLEQHVRPGERLIAIPPEWAALHFHLGTHADVWPWAYGWSSDLGSHFSRLRWDELDAVITLERPELGTEYWDDYGCGEAVRRLRERGFRPALRLRACTLWRPCAAGR